MNNQASKNLNVDTKVTWLIAVKNGMPYLLETLASIKAQTYTNWEILAWDNGSTDGTLEVLNEWIPTCLPGRVVVDRPMNLGLCRAEMVKESKTELCALIDADDINLPDRLERQVAFLEVNLKVAVVGSQINRLDANGVNHGVLSSYPTQPDDIVHFLLHDNPIAQPSVLLRRSMVLESGNYRDVGAVNIEDYDLWLRVASRYQLANLDVPLVNYRVHDKSTTQIAIRQNTLAEATSIRFCEHAPKLYGCSSEEAKTLRERRHPDAMRLLRQIALHLEGSESAQAQKRMRSATFVSAGRALVGNRDIRSRLQLAALSGSNWEIAKEAAKISKSALKSTRTYKSLKALKVWIEEQQKRRELAVWCKDLVESGVLLSLPLSLTGRQDAHLFLSVGNDCQMEHDVQIWVSPEANSEPSLELKRRVFIGKGSYIGTHKPITIGNNTIIGAYSYIISANHCCERRDVPIRDQGFTGAPIVIEDDVWLGTHVVVLPGVTIGKGAIVGAGAVVNKDIQPYEIWGGVPAKYLKDRP